MKIAIDAAQFSPAEANELRKAMATFRSTGTIGKLEEKMVGRMVARGYDPEFAGRCFDQIKGFGEYGFPESHAASFAQLVYVSSWLKCHYPAAFAAALLNSQPMGFYAPAQIVRDAREHGVTVHAPDVNFSDWDNTLEPQAEGGFALRLGLRQAGGLRAGHAARIMAAREAPFRDMDDLKTRTQLTAPTLRRLAEADALRSMFLDRRQALWEAKALRDAPDLPLFTASRDEGAEAPVALPAMPRAEQVVADYQVLRLSLKGHPIAFLRKSLAAQGYIPAAALAAARPGQRVRLAGLVLVRQRPGSAKGVCFITLEDETGVANLVIWPKVMAAFRKAVMQSRLLAVEGHVQRDVEIVHVVVARLQDRSDALVRLAPEGLAPPITRADEGAHPPASPPANPMADPITSTHARHPRDVRIIPKSRDFH